MRIKTVCICIAALTVCVPIGGCDMTSRERIEQLNGAVTWAQEQSAAMDATIGQLQAALATATELLADPNLASGTLENIREDIAKIEARLAAAVPVKALIDEKLAAYQAQLAEALAAETVDVQTEVELVGRGISAAAPAAPAPWNAWLAAIGGLVTSFGGLIAGIIIRGRQAAAQLEAAWQKHQNEKAEDVALWRERNEVLQNDLHNAKRATTGIVESVDALLASDIVTKPDAAKSILARHQAGKCPEAAAAVQQVRKQQALKVKAVTA